MPGFISFPTSLMLQRHFKQFMADLRVEVVVVRLDNGGEINQGEFGQLCRERTNGKSLSWMGLTRERWCCTMGLVSRLDMNTCQTSIKTDI